MERFGIDAVYGMHNLPGLPVGHVGLRPGPIMAATDEFEVSLRGPGEPCRPAPRGGRSDPGGGDLGAGAAADRGAQRRPFGFLVLSVTRFHSGFARNIIPDEALISGTVRSLTAATRDLAERRIGAIASAVAAAHGASAEVVYKRNYPVTVNDRARPLSAPPWRARSAARAR